MLDKIIDIKAGIARFGGKEETYYKSLLSFVTKYRDLPENENDDEYVRHIHTVKGVAGNLGITQLYEIAVKFNADPHNEDLKNQYLKIFDETAKLVLESISNNNHVIKTTQTGTAEELIANLFDLRASVEAFSISESESIVKTIVSTDWKIAKPIDFAPLKKASDSYDFISMNEIIADTISNISK